MVYQDFSKDSYFFWTYRNCTNKCYNYYSRYQGSYSPIETEYDDEEEDSAYYDSSRGTTNSGATRYEAGSYFDQSQENAGSVYNQNQRGSSGNSGGSNYVDGSYFEQGLYRRCVYSLQAVLYSTGGFPLAQFLGF